MPQLPDWVMSLVLDFRTTAGGEAAINREIAGLKKLETQSKSTARAALINLTKAFEQNMAGMSDAEKATSKFQGQLAAINRPAQASVKALLSLSERSKELAQETSGPLSDSLLRVSESLKLSAIGVQTATESMSKEASKSFGDLGKQLDSVVERMWGWVSGGIKEAGLSAQESMLGITEKISKGADISSKDLFRISDSMHELANSFSLTTGAEKEFRADLMPLVEQIDQTRERFISTTTAAQAYAQQAMLPLAKSLQQILPAAANLPPAFDSLVQRIYNTGDATSVSIMRFISWAEYLKTTLPNATAIQTRVMDEFIQKLNELVGTTVLAEEAQKDMERGGKGVFKQSIETIAGLDLAGAAAHGMMLATALLKGSITQLAFSVIFLRFNLVKLTLSFAKLFAVGIIFLKFMKLITWGIKKAGEWVGEFQSAIIRLGVTAEIEGRRIGKAFFEPFLKFAVAPALNQISKGIKETSADFQWLAGQTKELDETVFKRLGSALEGLVWIFQTLAGVMMTELAMALKIIGGFFVLLLSPVIALSFGFNKLIDSSKVVAAIFKGLMYPIGIMIWALLIKLTIAALKSALAILQIGIKMLFANAAAKKWIISNMLLNKTVIALMWSMRRLAIATLVLIGPLLATEAIIYELQKPASLLVKILAGIKWVLIGLAIAAATVAFVFTSPLAASIAVVLAIVTAVTLAFQKLAEWMGWSPGVGAVTTKLVKVWKSLFIPTLKSMWSWIKNLAYSIRTFLLPEIDKMNKSKVNTFAIFGTGEGTVNWDSLIAQWRVGFNNWKDEVGKSWDKLGTDIGTGLDKIDKLISGKVSEWNISLPGFLTSDWWITQLAGLQVWWGAQIAPGGILGWATEDWWVTNVFAPLSDWFDTGLYEYIFWMRAWWWQLQWLEFTEWWAKIREPGGVLYWTTWEWWSTTVWKPLADAFDKWLPDWLKPSWWWDKFKGILDALASIAAKVLYFLAIITGSRIETSTEPVRLETGPTSPPTFPTLEVPEITGLQYGGIVAKPMIAEIGERGPEAIIPLSRMNTSPSIYISISGNYIIGENASRELGDIVADRILKRMKTITPYSVR